MSDTPSSSDRRSEIRTSRIFALVATVAGLFVLRVKRPDEPRPYRAIGYPVLPAIYILMAVFIDVVLLRYKPQYTWPGLIIVLLGIPVYFLWSKRNPQLSAEE